MFGGLGFAPEEPSNDNEDENLTFSPQNSTFILTRFPFPP
jgi:hypothetical protein